MKIDCVGVVYKFSIFSILIYLLLLTFLISLGFWQLGRADEKSALLTKQQQAEASNTVELVTLVDEMSTIARYTKVELMGHYDPEHQYLIDNQIVNGQVGYFVMTPFKIDGINKAVLVNRGWVPLNKNRNILPDVSISAVKSSLVGRINHFPSVGIQLAGAEIPTEGWPSVVQVVDINVLSKRLAYSLLPFQIELGADMIDGYQRDWKKSKLMPPEKHVAYAVQWFGLAFTLTLLFIGFSRNKNERTA